MIRILAIFSLLLCGAASWCRGESMELLAEFTRGGGQPMGELVGMADGYLYGTTVAGGAQDAGTVFKVSPEGVTTTIFSFSGLDGAAPDTGLVDGGDGALYGLTSGGGLGGFGTAFKVTPTGECVSLVSFTGVAGAAPGSVPSGLAGPVGGNFYGVTRAGGTGGLGTVFKMSRDGTITTLVHFTGTTGATRGAGPVGALVVAGETLYGVTAEGGASNMGTIFKVSLTGGWSLMTEFTGIAGVRPGAHPAGGLALHTDGFLYGTTEFGGTVDFGTLFKISRTPTPVFTVVRSFDDPTGSQPVGRLSLDAAGQWWGVTATGGLRGLGTVFKISTAGTHTVLAHFSGRTGAVAGSTPRAGLTAGPGGSWYGVTSAGGPGEAGVVFRLSPAGVYTALSGFSPILGSTPSGAPAFDATGALLFPMAQGGGSGMGTLDRLFPSQSPTVAASFEAAVGAIPMGGLVALGAQWCGVTESEGASGRGTVFSYHPTTGLALKSDLTSSVGTIAEGPLLTGAAGELLGVASEGGLSGHGTLFKISSAGVRTRLLSFTGTAGSARGRRPRGPLTLSGIHYYGVTEEGGLANTGTLFRFSPAGVLTTLAQFGTTGPRSPRGGLVAGGDGYLYGTTALGGTADAGTVFQLDPVTGAWTVVAEFSGPNGAQPCGSLTRFKSSLYGQTAGGGDTDDGIIFRYTPGVGLARVLSYTGNGGLAPGRTVQSREAGSPIIGGLVAGPDGLLYGTAAAGGSGGGGTVFRMQIDEKTLTLAPATNGSITGLAASGLYTVGTPATLTAVPSAGYVFTGWTGAASGLQNPLSLVINSNQTIGATFAPQFSLTLSPATNGAITGLAASGIYTAGTTASLTAVADAGYVFTGWTGAASGLQNPLSLVINSNQTIGATFAPQFSLTLSPATNGAITGLAASGIYTAGTTASLTAVADAGYVFTGWTGAASGLQNPLSLVINSNQTIGATFAPQFSLTLSPATNGAITGLAASGIYTAGTTASLTAVPNAGYVFTGWTGAASGLQNPLSLVINSNQTIGATFAPQFSLTLSPATNGAITGLAASGIYTAGTTASLTAVADAGYVFTGWTGAASGLQNPLSLVINSNQTIGATFAPQFSLTLSPATNGAITGLAAGGVYTAGTTATLTAVPSAGYVFTGWTGAASGLQNPLSLVINSNQTIGATFAPQFSLTLSPSKNGAITGLAAGGVYTAGTTASLTAVPNAGYVFTGWTGAASGLQNPLSLVINSNQTIGATFAPQFSLTLSPATNGAITGLAAGGIYTAGTTASLTAVADAGYVFTGWTGAASGLQNPLSLVINSNQTIGATFAPQFSLTLSPATNGAITGLAAGGVYTAGTTATLTAVPNAGYVFTGWTGAASGLQNPLSLVINSNQTIGATFAPQFSLTLSPATNGAITGLAASGVYTAGTTASLTAVADAGYVFTGWTGAASGLQNPLSLVINSNQTIGATFAPQFSLTLSPATNGAITGLAASGIYTAGTTASLTAVADAGYIFTGWTGAASGLQNPLSLVINSNQTIGATFAPQFSLTLSPATNGAITGLAASGIYTAGTTASLTAVADAGYIFTGWTGAASGLQNPLSLVINSNQTIGATFAPQFSLTLSPSKNGAINGLAAGGVYTAGTTATLNAVPSAGYIFTGWTGAASGLQNPLSLVINSNQTIGATFALQPTPQFSLTLSPATNGAITGLAAGGVYTAGTTASLTAVPNAGYVFTGWTGAASGLQNPLSLVINSNQTIGATFAPQFSLTLSPATNGAITGLAAGGVYTAGTTASLNAVADAGYVFTGWTGAASGLQNPLSLVINSNQTIGATFAPQFSLTLSPATNGAITGLAAGGVYTAGTTATLTAVPSAGYVFTGWTGAASGLQNPLSLVINSNQTIGATFAPQFSLTLSPATNGAITGLAAGGVYTAGTTATLTAVPSAGYVFTGWTGAASGLQNPLSLVINSNQTIGATFAPQFSLTLSPATNGAITGLAASGVYTAGTTATLTAVPNAGYIFTGWTGAASGLQNPLSLVINSNQTLGATFAPQPTPQFTLTLSPATNGAITGLAAGGVYTAGTTASLTAVADAGYVFTGWTGAASGLQNPLSLVINSNQTIGATFAPQPAPQFTLTLSPATNGAITGLAAGGVYTAGTTASLTAVADAGYVFTGWTGAASGLQNPLSLVINNNQTLGATFALQPTPQFTLTLSPATNGAITGLAAGGVYTAGTTASLTAVADAGYVFTGWTGAASGLQNPLSLVINNNQTLGATFALQPTPQFSLTLSPATNGAITGLAAGGVYTAGTTASLTAVPSAGYVFTGWTGAASGLQNPLSLVINSNQTLGATFALQPTPQFTLTLSPATNGAITGLAAGGVYTAGTTASLTAVPSAGYVFTGWTGAASGLQNPLSLVINSNQTIGATFAPQPTPQFTLTLSPATNGAITGLAAGGVYPAGTIATLTAVPDPGCVFVGWTGSISATENPLRLIMNADQKISATFAAQPIDPFSAWKIEQVGHASADDLSDLDHDGFTLLEEYAFQLEATQPDASHGPVTKFARYADGTSLSITLSRDPARHDVTLSVEVASSLLGPWTPIATSLHGAPFSGAGYVQGENEAPGLKNVEIRDPSTVERHKGRFMRVKITK